MSFADIGTRKHQVCFQSLTRDGTIIIMKCDWACVENIAVFLGNQFRFGSIIIICQILLSVTVSPLGHF